MGVYPLVDTRHTVWACVDIDTDDLDLTMSVVRELENLNLWPHVETSRSKGYHVWVFYDAWVPASWQRWVYPEIVARLGHPKLECNPKQSRSSEIGNYVRLPYPGRTSSSPTSPRRVFLDSRDAGRITRPVLFEQLEFQVRVSRWQDLRKAAFRSPLGPATAQKKLELYANTTQSLHGGEWSMQESARFLQEPDAIIPYGRRDETFHVLCRLLAGMGMNRYEATETLQRIHRHQVENVVTFPWGLVEDKIRRAFV